jgi:glycerate 2-kinase
MQARCPGKEGEMLPFCDEGAIMRRMIPPERFETATLRESPFGASVTRILSAALDAVDPAAAVRRAVAYLNLDLEPGGRIFVIAIGKASVPMADAMTEILGGRLTGGVIITKHAPSKFCSTLTVIEGGHPVPDERSLAAGAKIHKLLSGLTAADLVFCLISGGGSALVASPVDGVTLSDLQSLTADLLACGARVDEINILRRHFDVLKGGGLARLAAPARVVSLILSDVVGDPLEAIASGPTAPDPTTRADALSILAQYSLSEKHSQIVNVLRRVTETPKPGDPIFENVSNRIVGDNLIAAQAALKQAEVEGFNPYLLRTDLQGEARDASVELCRILRWSWQTGDPARRPACIVVGGETTVTLCPHPGRGGRNTELALASVTELANFPGVMLVTLATDGEDGPTDAAGAVVTGETFNRINSLGLTTSDFLARNDSYSFFESLDDLLKPGPTGTNVNDLTFLFTF